ncbi:SapC family protein [Glacieibacterium sp.]|uniref:SapC family protein n=1 Tax=Glacieibacterium sp. TaxID=2860237 RepID=UPI003AFFC27E
MTEQLEILNTETHKALRMHGFVGQHPSFVTIVLGEFAAAAAVCPIFFAKDPETGAFFVGAVFGFKPGETLVEGAGEVDGLFRPLDLQRQGFLFTEEEIAVDVAHPRFAGQATIALFDEDGEPSGALRRIQWALGQLKGGLDATTDFINALLKLKLIESIDISLKFDDGETVDLTGLYTISRDRLAELEGADVVELFQSGYLQAAHCILFSLNQIGVLARRRNRRLAGA